MRRSLPALVGLAVSTLTVGVVAASTGAVGHVIGWVEAAASTPGPAGMAIYVVVYVAAAHLLLPASAGLTVLAGFVYGFVPGLVLGLVANTVACVTQWWAGARALGSRTDALVAANPWLERTEQAARTRVVRLVALARLSPVVPFSVLNYAAGARRIPVGPYAIGTALGLLPSELALVYAGVLARAGAAGASAAAIERTIAIAGVVATIALLGWAWHLGRRAARQGPPEARVHGRSIDVATPAGAE